MSIKNYIFLHFFKYILHKRRKYDRKNILCPCHFLNRYRRNNGKLRRALQGHNRRRVKKRKRNIIPYGYDGALEWDYERFEGKRSYRRFIKIDAALTKMDISILVQERNGNGRNHRLHKRKFTRYIQCGYPLGNKGRDTFLFFTICQRIRQPYL